MAGAQVIAADNNDSWAPQRIFSFHQQSGGEPVRLALGSNATGAYYATYRAGAIGWDPPVSFSGSDLFGMGAWAATKTQPGSGYTASLPTDGSPVDVVYVFYLDANGQLNLVALSFTGPATITVQTFGPVLVTSDTSPASGYRGYDFCAAVWDAGNRVWHVAMAYHGFTASPSILLAVISDHVLTSLEFVDVYDRLMVVGGWTSLVIGIAPVGGGAGATVFVGVCDLAGDASMLPAPVNYPATPPYSFGENVPPSSVVEALPDTTGFDISQMAMQVGLSFSGDAFHTATEDGTIQFALAGGVGSSAGIWTCVRGGTNSYSHPRQRFKGLDVANPSFAYDTNTGALYLAFETAQDEPNGEVFLIRQPAGSRWEPAYVLIGDDNTGYTDASLGALFDSAAAVTGQPPKLDVLFAQGIPAAQSLRWLEQSATHPPSSPENVTPAGPSLLGSLTNIVVTWTYVNVVPTDLQGQYRIQVHLNSDGSLAYDSGWLAGAAETDVIAATLVEGSKYALTLGTRDAAGGGEAQTIAHFTPYLVSAITISTVDEGPASSGATGLGPTDSITSALVDIHFSTTSTTGQRLRAYRMSVIDTDGVSILTQSDWIPCDFGPGEPAVSEDFNVLGGGTLLNDNATRYWLRVDGIFKTAEGEDLMVFSPLWG